jgi:hypothetical protein
LRTANIGFDIVANPDNLSGRKPKFFDRRLERRVSQVCQIPEPRVRAPMHPDY